MIKINATIDTISIEGHTKPDVCSAVSTVSTTIINCLIQLCDDSEYKYELDSGDCTIKFLKWTEITNALYDVLLNELQTLSEDYPECVKFI